MRIRWRGLELPSRVVRDEQVSTETFGRFTAEPFERGFGTTVGNSLRRILLSSLEGAAVTHIKLKGAQHEFSSLAGVMEDVTDIILNIKSLIVKCESDEPKEIKLVAKKAGPVTAGMIETDPSVTIFNKNMVIATLTEDVNFEMTLKVAKGRGYKTASENNAELEEQEIGQIAVDSIFSPVTRVRYSTEDARVGQKTDYDRLVLEIWTNGTISPEMALVEASKILRKHLNPFVQYFELGSELANEDAIDALRDANKAMVDPELENKLNMTVQELDLSVRANNCLESAKIQTVRELVQKTDLDLLKVRSFGKTSLREVKRKLADMGLSLGMDLSVVQQGGMDAAVMPDDDEDEMAESDEQAAR
ncbi:DNA-directed RNA polymerase subunit alpha [Humisphaera borealis]|uniref:DNA-directed RNA polymerase subunit alpha n=1 Tax=Humisphaera borealis TaxID=2807512 RepID=A0A7M2WS05_9BACT|nr:DNA-directed RNA polymerase subunit alpha [Humisphaera borealis]QOV88223.1 DNA-directed RNA polymerase subunit alpha [Humisphaera borealis]